MQAAAASFASEPLGHKFVLAQWLTKATAGKCAACGQDIRTHHRDEATDAQLLAVLNAQDDGKATVILPGELAVGSYKAALAVAKAAKTDMTTVVLNCAGTKLHEFMPLTRKEFDKLRCAVPSRLLDLEWEDSDCFELPWADVERALTWTRSHVAQGSLVLINCAQGKSRSGVMAVAYLMAKLKLTPRAALATVQAKRPLVEPNPTFMRRLDALQAQLHAQPSPMGREEARLRRAFATYDQDHANSLNLQELQFVPAASGETANGASGMLKSFGTPAKS